MLVWFGLAGNRNQERAWICGGTHVLGEGDRWDLRVLIYYKSREAQATGRGIGQKLFPDQATFRKEEQERWRLTLRHYDLPITEVDPHAERTGGN